MQMHQIRYFLALTRTLNFTHAASECNVSQPALTKAIKKLEEELGGPLIHRERDHTHLTHLGRMVQPFLEQVYASSQAARDLAEGLRRGDRTPIAIGVSDGIDKQHLLGPIREIRCAVDGLELRFEGGADNDLGRRLLGGDLDVALVETCAAADERIRFYPLYTERMGVLMRESHPLCEAETLSLDDIRDEHWIDTQSSMPHQRFSDAMRELDIHWNARHHAARPMEAQVLALSDLGITLAGEREPIIGGLMTRPLRDPLLERQMGVAMARGRRPSIACETLVRLFRAQTYEPLSIDLG